MTFTIVGSLFGILLIGCAACALTILPSREHLWRTIPRERIVGAVLSVACLAWSAMYAYPLLEGNLEKFRGYLTPLVVVLSILSYFLLDYLFTRAIGGGMLLLTCWLMHEAFVVHAPFRPAFSVVCYVLGVAGMVFIAMPYRFRDLLEKVIRSTSWRFGVSLLLSICGVVILLGAALPNGQ